MTRSNEVTQHYGRGGLLERLEAALRDDGVDPARPTFEALAPYDQFHGRGQEATAEAIVQMQAGQGDHLLDIGSGIGGPARQVARQLGCKVTGIDLTAEFCDVATELTRRLGQQDRVAFGAGDALSMPFADASFDGAYSMNVSMNIADKTAFYREIHRVLKPGAWLLLSEIARGEGPEPDYPTPWAASAATSFLATVAQTRAGLQEAGFEVVSLHSTAAQSRAYGERARALVERGEKPPHRAVMLIHSALAAAAMANTGCALKEGRIDPIEVLARKRA